MTNISVESLGNGSEAKPQSKPPEWRRYFSFSRDHKVIGIQYLVTSFVFFLIGGFLAMIIRAELITPKSDVVDRALYNGMFTMHGSIMIFLWIFPTLLGLANYLVPLMIGARDMAFPKLNAVAFWLVPIFGHFAACLAISYPTALLKQDGGLIHPLVHSKSWWRFHQRTGNLAFVSGDFWSFLDYGSRKFCCTTILQNAGTRA